MVVINFIEFIRKGTLPLRPQVSFILLVKLFLFLFFSQLIFTSLILILANFNWINYREPPVSIFLEGNISQADVLMLVLMVGFVYPIIEELVFRFNLKFSSVSKISIGITFILSFVASSGYDFFKHLGINLGSYSFLIQFVFFVVILIQLVKRSLGFTNVESIYIFARDNTRALVLVSSVVFSVYHLGTSSNTEYYILYLVILFPYIVMAYILSFVRLWLGLRYSILLHSSFNIVLLSIKYFSLS